jgi:hypothetical protein
MNNTKIIRAIIASILLSLGLAKASAQIDPNPMKGQKLDPVAESGLKACEDCWYVEN